MTEFLSSAEAARILGMDPGLFGLRLKKQPKMVEYLHAEKRSRRWVCPAWRILEVVSDPDQPWFIALSAEEGKTRGRGIAKENSRANAEARRQKKIEQAEIKPEDECLYSGCQDRRMEGAAWKMCDIHEANAVKILAIPKRRRIIAGRAYEPMEMCR